METKSTDDIFGGGGAGHPPDALASPSPSLTELAAEIKLYNPMAWESAWGGRSEGRIDEAFAEIIRKSRHEFSMAYYLLIDGDGAAAASALEDAADYIKHDVEYMFKNLYDMANRCRDAAPPKEGDE